MAIVVLVVAGVAFFAGTKFSPAANQQARGNRAGQFTNRSEGGGRPVSGEVLSLDDKSLTVKLPDGSSKIVLLTDNVTVSKTESGTKTDLQIGSKVGIFGTDNSDGTITAANIQLNPMFRGSQASDSAQRGGSAR